MHQEEEKNLGSNSNASLTKGVTPLLGDQRDSTKVTTTLGDMGNGLILASESLGDVTTTREQYGGTNVGVEWSQNEDGMELGEDDHNWKESDEILEFEDEFQDLTDGEDKIMTQEGATEATEENALVRDTADTEAPAMEKKVAPRKPLFSGNVGVHTKKFTQVLMSPRKCVAPKQTGRKGGGGGGAKKMEDKGPLNPKQLPKP